MWVKLANLRWWTLSAAVALAGCSTLRSLSAAGLGNQGAANISGSTVESLGTLISGHAVAPALVANNNAGLVSNNAAGLVSNNNAGLVSNNAAGYSILALPGEASVVDALVYLTDPRERFFKDAAGNIVSAKTDAQGQYQVGGAIPVGQSVIVNVVLADDQREVGFTIPQQGKNTVNVSLATTIVTEFLRHRADVDSTVDGKTIDMASYPGMKNLAALPNLTQLTDTALSDGSLATPSLKVADIPLMDQAYAVAVGNNVDGLGQAWQQALGYHIVVGTTLVGDGFAGDSGDCKPGKVCKPASAAEVYTPKGLAADASGDIFISEESGQRVREVTPDGFIHTVVGDSNAGPDINDVPGTQAELNWPRTVVMGPDGNLYISDVFNERIRALCLVPGTSFGVNMATVGNVYDIAGNPVCLAGQCEDGYDGSGDPALVTAPATGGAQLTGVRGMTFDPAGDLIFTDTWGWSGTNGDPGDPSNNIRHHVRILMAHDAASAYGLTNLKADHVYTIAGADGWFGFDGDASRPALGAKLNYAQSVISDKQGNLYVADADNNRVREITTSGQIFTVAGCGQVGNDDGMVPGGDGGPATQASLPSPYGLAFDSQGDLYISEPRQGVIRMVDPQGIIHTVAGDPGGPTADGDALEMSLNQPHDLLWTPKWGLLEADARGQKVHMFNLP